MPVNSIYQDLANSASLQTYLELQRFFHAAPPRLSVDRRGHTTSVGTRKPAVFDRHLHKSYRLERVFRVPGILRDLIDNTEMAMFSRLPYLPAFQDSDEFFPSTLNRTTVNKVAGSNASEVRSEHNVRQIYAEMVAKFCAPVACTLEFRLGDWANKTIKWGTERMSHKPIAGVKANQAVADGLLNLVEMDSWGHHYHLTSRQREIFNVFPELAIWEFKNLNFCPEGETDEISSGEVFHEIVNGFLSGIFPWEGCEKKNDCMKSHPKVGATACRMGYDAVQSPCPSYDLARRELHGQKLESLHTKGVTTSFDGMTAKKKSARKILQQASLFTFINFRQDFLIVPSQVWAEAVAMDVTFVIIQAGNIEIIGMRDRANQCLYLTDVFNVDSREYPYFKLHTGLYIAAIRDAEDRADSVVNGEIPFTWKMETGTGVLKAIDCRRNSNQEAVATLLSEIYHRQWLVIQAQSTDELKAAPLRLPFCMDPYKRVGIDLPEDEWEGAPTSKSFGAFKEHFLSKDSLSHYEHFQLIAQVDHLQGQDTYRAKVEVPGIIFNRDFRNAEKPWVIIKKASCRQDILRFKRESLLSKLHEEGIVHGNLTWKSLVVNRSEPHSMDVSIVGFERVKVYGYENSGILPEKAIAEMKEERKLLKSLLAPASYIRGVRKENSGGQASKKLGKVSSPRQGDVVTRKTLYHGRDLR
ncbi:hypothetical protein C0992_012174 [Termitomyces sp. T32_za158]|nr:hypothetical protein C0992_012174 [Termitomyces sp. T32_za158]